MLELYDGKLSRTVLMGERGRKTPDLPDYPMLNALREEVKKNEDINSPHGGTC